MGARVWSRRRFRRLGRRFREDARRRRRRRERGLVRGGGGGGGAISRRAADVGGGIQRRETVFRRCLVDGFGRGADGRVGRDSTRRRVGGRVRARTANRGRDVGARGVVRVRALSPLRRRRRRRSPRDWRRRSRLTRMRSFARVNFYDSSRGCPGERLSSRATVSRRLPRQNRAPRTARRAPRGRTSSRPRRPDRTRSPRPPPLRRRDGRMNFAKIPHPHPPPRPPVRATPRTGGRTSSRTFPTNGRASSRRCAATAAIGRTRACGIRSRRRRRRVARRSVRGTISSIPTRIWAERMRWRSEGICFAAGCCPRQPWRSRRRFAPTRTCARVGVCSGRYTRRTTTIAAPSPR